MILTLSRSRSRGLSLAELMISIVILAFLSVLMVGIIPATILGLRSASERATAALLVQAALEDVRKQPFDTLSSHSSTRTLNGRTYQVQAVVGAATGSNGNALEASQAKKVSIEVRWQAKGGQKVERFETLVARTHY